MQEREQNKKDKEVEGSNKTVTAEEKNHVSKQFINELKILLVHTF